jgi:hypothetical protein
MPSDASTPTFLRRLRLREVSLVPRGANQRADVLIVKSDADPGPASAERSMRNPIVKFLGGLKHAVLAMATTDAQRAAVAKGFGDAEAALAEPVTDGGADNGDGNGAAAVDVAAIADAVAEKMAARCAKAGCGGMIEKGKCAKCGAMTKADNSGDAAMDQEAINKAIGDAVGAVRTEFTTAITKAQADITKANERADAAEAKVATLEKAQSEQTNIAKAQELLGELPGDAKPIASLLAKASPEERAEFEKIAKAGNAATQSARLFVPAGRDVAMSGSALAEIESKAAQVAKDQKITKEQAFDVVVKADPSLYTRYRAENEIRPQS